MEAGMEVVGPSTGVRVLLVDEHALFREGLALALAGVDDIEIVGEAADGHDALRAVTTLSPDVVVMDVRMPEDTGPAEIARLRGARPETKVLVLTGSQDEGDLVDAIRCGATGYLLRDASVDAVAEAIRSVAQGMGVVSPLMTTKLLEQFGALLGHLPDWRRPQLTGREIDVLRLVVKGMPNREIATELFISQNTVKNHVRSILEKLRVRSKADAAAVATREGLLAVD
jgi:two-component system NarL family response regulator